MHLKIMDDMDTFLWWQLGPVFTLHVAGERLTFLTEAEDFHHFFQSSNVDFQRAVQDPVQNIGKSYHLILNTQNMTVTMYCIVRKCLIYTVEVIYYMYSTCLSYHWYFVYKLLHLCWPTNAFRSGIIGDQTPPGYKQRGYILYWYM